MEEEKVKGFIDQEKVSLETEKHIIDHKDNIALKSIGKEDEHLLLLLLNDLYALFLPNKDVGSPPSTS